MHFAWLTANASLLATAAVAAAIVAGSSRMANAAPSFAAPQAGQSPVGIRDLPLPLPGGAAAPGTQENAAVQFLSPAEITVPPRHSTEVNLTFRVAKGLHINSHAPREKYLVPARLAVVEGGGLEVTSVDFPPGVDYALALAPQEKLSVYTGDFVLRAHLTAAPGEHMLHAALRYQACDRNSCMPPSSLPVTVRVVAK
jgi:hypothetical protein